MKKLFNTLLLLTVIVGGLHLTNPDQEALSDFLAVYVQEELADEAGDETELGKKLRKGLGQLAGVAAEALAERTELYVASVYSLDIAGESHVFVGVAGQFIPVRNK